MQTSLSPQAFIERLATRNYDQLAETLAPDAVARFLLPPGHFETSGADTIARLFEGWFGAAENFTVLSTHHKHLGQKWFMQWRFRLSLDGDSTDIIEQVAFADVGPEGIVQLDLLCSGLMSDAQMTAEDVQSCLVRAGHRQPEAGGDSSRNLAGCLKRATRASVGDTGDSMPTRES